MRDFIEWLKEADMFIKGCFFNGGWSSCAYDVVNLGN